MLKRLLNRKRNVGVEIPGPKSSYSQCGEDLIIQYIFNLRRVRLPSYLDIGANNPFYLSNTAVFYNLGSRGINVEANTELLTKFFVHRPQDRNVNVGVAAKSGNATFYMLNDSTLSTFSKKEAIVQVEQYGRTIDKEIELSIMTINEIIMKYSGGIFPEFLSIDVEGTDFEILETADFSTSKPKVICAETAEYSPIGAGEKRKAYIKLIEDKGYYLYADTNLNSIFVENSFWFV